MARPNSASPTRSRSPAPDRPRDKTKSKTSKSSGFRWKDKKTTDNPSKDPKASHDPGSSRDPLDTDEHRTRTHYRDRSSSRERKRRRREDEDIAGAETAPPPQPAQDDDIAAKFGPSASLPQTQNGATAAPSKVDADIAAKFGSSAAVSHSTTSPNTTSTTTALPQTASNAAITTTTAPKTKPPKSTSTPRPPSGPMIIVKINDRLGTTSKVPCLASDSVGDFKRLVAMRIGRKPHEIMLKRQSERPFKDFLTLEDYGVSDGVQLDLELDTGD